MTKEDFRKSSNEQQNRI